MKKKLAVIFTLLVVFVCINTVSATDNIENTTIFENNTLEDQNITLNETLRHDVMVTNVSPHTSYVDINNGSDSYDGTNPIHIGGMIGPFQSIQRGIAELSRDGGGTLHIAAGKYSVLEELVLEYDSNIYGAGMNTTIIEEGNNTRIFMINENINVNITNLSIMNGKGSKSGGGIFNKGNLTIKNFNICNNHTGDGNNADFTNSAGDGGNGSGICNTGILTIKSSLIHNNLMVTVVMLQRYTALA
jgi:hypothetical protein